MTDKIRQPNCGSRALAEVAMRKSASSMCSAANRGQLRLDLDFVRTGVDHLPSGGTIFMTNEVGFSLGPKGLGTLILYGREASQISKDCRGVHLCQIGKHAPKA